MNITNRAAAMFTTNVVRIYMTGNGCDGIKFVFDFDNIGLDVEDTVINIRDVGIVIVDPFTLLYLEDAEIVADDKCLNVKCSAPIGCNCKSSHV